MTPMMSAIWRLLVLIWSIAAIAWLTTWPPFSAWARAPAASWLACWVFPAFCVMVLVISSMLEAVSPRAEACACVRWFRWMGVPLGDLRYPGADHQAHTTDLGYHLV